MKVIAGDLGNAQCKSIHFVFPSGLTRSKVYPSSATHVLHYGDLYYSLSSERLAYDETKLDSEDYRVLMYFIIARELEKTHDYEEDMDIVLSVGLPPEHMFDAEKIKAWKRYFTPNGRRHVTFEYNEKPYSINIKGVDVTPQGYAALFAEPKAFEDMSTIYLVDIGGYTVDLIKINADGSIDSSMIRSLNLGMITFYNDCIGNVKKDLRIDLKEQTIIDYLNGKKTKRAEVNEIIESSLKEYVRKVINKLRELGIELKMDNVVFLGGGARFIKDEVEKASDHSKGILILTDEKINARGYQAFTERRVARK